MAEIFAVWAAQEDFSCDFRKDEISSGFFPALAQAVLGSQLSRGGTLAGANGSCDEKRENKAQNVAGAGAMWR